MNKKRLYSPEIDGILEWMKRGSSQPVAAVALVKKIAQTLNLIKKIKPRVDLNDRIWTLWLRSERGTISVFGSFDEYKEEGQVDSYEEFESLWKDEYPDEIKWHQVTLLLYQDRLFLNVDSKGQIEANIQTGEITGADVEQEDINGFILWLLDGLEKEVNDFLKNPEAYNKFIAEDLPLRKRIGKIKRMDIWEGVEDAVCEAKELGAENLKKFEHVVRNVDKSRMIKEMTVNAFLRYCEIGYDANEYFHETRSPREKYEAFADLRHGGLLDLDPDSPEAFRKWYESGAWAGTHPWEICRGGNTTHISLQVAREGKDWKLYLAGFFRAVETARMAIALFDHGVPFILHQQDEMLRMLQGIDYLGIVPEQITPRYCHSMFPQEDRINDFLNPWHDPELVAVVKEKAIWYPAEALRLETETSA